MNQFPLSISSMEEAFYMVSYETWKIRIKSEQVQDIASDNQTLTF